MNGPIELWLKIKNNKMKFALRLSKVFGNIFLEFLVFQYCQFERNFWSVSYWFFLILFQIEAVVRKYFLWKIPQNLRRCQNSTKCCLQMFFEIGALKNFAIFTGKHQWESLFNRATVLVAAFGNFTEFKDSTFEQICRYSL